MDSAVRWSVHSTAQDQQFLHVDVPGRLLRLCRLTSAKRSPLTYETIATYSHLPAFRAFDWSPANPELVAVGQSSGEATVLRIHEGPEARIAFPLRSQRLCNAVALNTQDLLAVGLDKVRNDFCLNVWDLNQRVTNITTGGGRAFSSDKGHGELYAKFASSEPITSIKFFTDQPQTLVAGVKGQSIRIYDLREPHASATLQFATRCVHNLTIDPCNENYIASCVPNNEPVISIWDRRVGGRSQMQTSGFSSTDSNPTGPSLELKNVVDNRGSIWGLRFAKSKSGCLGMLTSSGQFKTFQLGKEPVSEADVKERNEAWGQGWKEFQPEDIFLERIQEIEKPSHSGNAARKGDDQIVSFDFISQDEDLNGPGVLTLTADGKFEISGLGCARSSRSFSPFPANSSVHISANQRHQMDGNIPTHPLHERKDAPQASGKQVIPKESLDPMRIFRERCEMGYQFDPVRNRSIVGSDISLSTFWRNIHHATSLANSSSLVDEELDLSFLGVYNIWMDELGVPPPFTNRRVNPSTRPNPDPSDTIETLASTLRLLPLTPSPQTSYLAHRRLCLYILGLQRTPTTLETKVNKLSRNNPTKAAALALFSSQPRLANRALRQKNSSETHKMLAMAIASAKSRQKQHMARSSSTSESESEDSESEWKLTLSSLLSSIPPPTEDPYAHAIIRTIIHGTPAHPSILSNPNLPLPLRDRILIAIHHLPDLELTSYISKLTRICIFQGDLDGIILTGLASPDAVSLFSNYISRTGDVQTAVAALTPVIPRYIADKNINRLFECWREAYRTQMQIWDLKFHRVKFDVTSRKLAVSRTGVPLILPAKKQISINCTYCQQAVTQFPEPAKPGYTASDPTTNPNDQTIATAANKPGLVPTTIQSRKTPRHNPLAAVAASNKAAAIGTICPKCGRSLPRCGICELPLGMPDPTYIKPVTVNNSSNLSSQTTNKGNRPGTRVATDGTRAGGTTNGAAPASSTDTPGPASSSSKRTSIFSTATASTAHPVQTSSIPTGTASATYPTTTAAASPSSNNNNNNTSTIDPSAESSYPQKEDKKVVQQREEEEEEEDQQQQQEEEEEEEEKINQTMAHFVTFCIACSHGFHAHHARDWFVRAGHRECPVAECECVCAV